MIKKNGTAVAGSRALLTAIAFAAAAAGSAPAAAQGVMHNTKAIAAGAAFDGFIVRYREGTLEKADARMVSGALSNLNARARTSTLLQGAGQGTGAFALQHARRMSRGSDVVRSATRLTPAQALEAMRLLAQLPGVEYVEPNMIMQAAMAPNDPRYGEQWNLSEPVVGIRAAGAWDKANGAGVTIAIIDTGMTVHPDLQGNRVDGYDFITEAAQARDRNGRDPDASDNGDWRTYQHNCGDPRNSSWHGTHVAGIAAAAGNNGTGIIGVAYGAKIMPVRVLGPCGGAVEDIADAIEWASGTPIDHVPTLPAEAQAKVINLSLGARGTCSPTLQESIDRAVSRGSTVVVASGNHRPHESSEVSGYQPASCNRVVVVASTSRRGERASDSIHGAKVDLAAPGLGIMSTINDGINVPGMPTYRYESGTSMSTPQVSGVVALMQSRRLALGMPLIAPADVEQLLQATAQSFPVNCSGCGVGILDADAAVVAAAAGPDLSASRGAVKISEHTDASGRITMAIFARKSTVAQAHFYNFAIEVPDDYVVVGGGAEGRGAPTGNLLTASYPNTELNAWVVSSKDHGTSDPVALRGWAIGLKIAGLTRQQVRDAISVTSTVSGYGAHPRVSSTVPSGYLLIGGGFRVDWTGAGNLGVSSYPETAQTWTAHSKDHGTSSPATATAYAIGIRSQIAGVGLLSTVRSHIGSVVSTQPAANIRLHSGFALTSCGAEGQYNNGIAHNLLWRIQPVDSGSHRSCFANSKDHFYSSAGIIHAYALGLRAN